MRNFPDLIEDYIREKQKRKQQDFCAASWLDSASKKASQLHLATHVLKYTHSEAKGTNIRVKSGSKQGNCLQEYLSTDALDSFKDDVAGNAAALGVAGFLQIELNGVTLLDLIAKDDSSALAPFAKNQIQLTTWMSGFKSVFTNRDLSSNTLAKQIYFPVEDNQYHLLSPLYASSLSQRLYEQVHEDRFGEKAKEARASKKNKRYSDVAVVSYPKLAIQRFGGNKPQNISRLNTVRKGESYLLRSAPPIWMPIQKPPGKNGDFWKSYGKRGYELLREFKHYLISVKNVDSNQKIRKQISAFVDQLLDLLFQIAAEVQAMEPGWSKTSEITENEQFWLDPLRGDQNFQETRSNGTWKRDIADRFATWLIQKLKDKNLTFSDADHKEFSSRCLKILKDD
ncbi:MAG: type I-F CRISPR-associated protein Csy1 [Waddliaceae bacterium]